MRSTATGIELLMPHVPYAAGAGCPRTTGCGGAGNSQCNTDAVAGPAPWRHGTLIP